MPVTLQKNKTTYEYLRYNFTPDEVRELGLFGFECEFTFRLNEGNVKEHTLSRLDSFISAVAGKRLTYARLTA